MSRPLVPTAEFQSHKTHVVYLKLKHASWEQMCIHQLHNDMFNPHICISTYMHIKSVMLQHSHVKLKLSFDCRRYWWMTANHIAPVPNPPVSHLVCQPHDASVAGHRDWSFLQSHCAPGQWSDSSQCIQLGPKSIVSSGDHLRFPWFGCALALKDTRIQDKWWVGCTQALKESPYSAKCAHLGGDGTL